MDWEWKAAAVTLAVLTLFAGITIAIGGALALDILKKLPSNGFGLVKGVDDANASNLIALTTWLTTELELTAGLVPGTPLTFSMLWRPDQSPEDHGLDERPIDPVVNLEMVTTNITFGRPYRFPTSSSQFFFDPEEFRAYFPEHVVKWMVDRSRPARNEKEQRRLDVYSPLLPLPPMGDLPVVVATRMSLSFPVLLCAVPLYVADFSVPIAEGDQPQLERCWFSDGGISSNFPITMFDAPLPRWPTFAINLASFPSWRPRSDDETQNIYMPATNNAGRLPSFTRFESVQGFIGSLVNAMQNWNDNTQVVLPGYRDRIVTVFLDEEEGGLNLDMPPPVLSRLRKRGEAAGALIASRFAAPSELKPSEVGMNWENHRWLRYRSTMGALKTYLGELARAYSDPESPDTAYSSLIEASSGTPAKHYPLARGIREKVAAVTEQLAGLGEAIGELESLDDNLPKPAPDLVVRPSLDA